MKRFLLAAALAALATLPVAAQSLPSGVAVSGGMLVDGRGMTLYTFDKDTPGKSVCNGPCLVNWPALAAPADAAAMGDWTVVSRDDGARQWAYKGKPLYTFIQDKKPGDMTGEGKGNVWHMAMP